MPKRPSKPDPRGTMVRRIVALASLLQDHYPDQHHGLRLREHDHEMLELDDIHEREPSSWVTFHRSGARVVEHTCEYSGHNGDPYGHKERDLDEAAALKALQGLNDLLERRCLAAEERRLEEAAHRARQELALSNLNTRLRGMGVP